jgi:16S rRNA (adenine1518-N6/adenine1519-N6)-dimethyltransferase
VTSAIVRLEPREDAEAVPVAALEAVTAAAFGQRRKMLRSSLKQLWPDPEPFLARADIDSMLRAEQVDVAGFVRLARIRAAL